MNSIKVRYNCNKYLLKHRDKLINKLLEMLNVNKLLKMLIVNKLLKMLIVNKLLKMQDNSKHLHKAILHRP